MTIPHYLLLVVAGFALAMAVYVKTNKGIPDRSVHQQTTRFAIAALLAMLPLGISGASLRSPAVIASAAIALLWMVTYPLLFHLTNQHTASEYDHKIDEAFALYLFGMLTALAVTVQGRWVAVDALMGIAYFTLFFVPVFQIAWWVIYRTCVDSNGMKILQETNVNEALEFLKSFSATKLLAVLLAVLLVVAGSTAASVCADDIGSHLHTWQTAACAAVLLLLLYETLRRPRGAFWRTGIMELYFNVKEYIANNRRYTTELRRRLDGLHVERLGKKTEGDKPHTIIMVIGESACRDYMSAWHPDRAHDTTPWMRQMGEQDPHAYIFHHAYSCAIQTVPSLERALTEANQYNDKQFYQSCSIVDIAHKLGYRVHWYSNQGHLGVADTPITLVADTADVAKWTHQEVGKVQYDESLLGFLDEVDPQRNNFVVLHLKGSHFNYLNRYPAAFTRWGEAGVQDDVTNYENSLAYTDTVLQRVFEYARQRLNLQAMVYFSDHGNEPGKRRQPSFSTFQMTRIPLFVWLSADYAASHPERDQALRDNTERYFTNDLAYELLCGILDIRSDHFEASNSLASSAYRYRREDLLTYEGRVRIADDTTP